MPCRIRAFFKELGHDWDRLNLAAKVLVVIGGFLFLAIVFIALYQGESVGLKNKTEVIFRSAMASVFGYILSSNTKNSGIKNKEKIGMSRSNKKDKIEECLVQVDENDKYYYSDGNSVQILIALFTAVASGVIILFIFMNNVKYDEAILSQFRDFMCTSIGFLIGESKIKSEN